MSRTVRFTSDVSDFAKVRRITAARRIRLVAAAALPVEVVKTVSSLVETVRHGGIDAPARF